MCPRWSGRYGCPPRQARVLYDQSDTNFIDMEVFACVFVPTVMGLILTPSSTWAELGSSDSLWPRTLFPQRVLTKVVLPVKEKIKGIQSAYQLLAGKESTLGSRRDVKPRGEIKHTSARCSADHQAELDTLLHVLLAADHLLLIQCVSVIR